MAKRKRKLKGAQAYEQIRREGRISDLTQALSRAFGPQAFEESPVGGLGLDAAIEQIRAGGAAETPPAPRIDERKHQRIVRVHARHLVPCFVDDTERGESTLAIAALMGLPDETRSRALEGFAALLEIDAPVIQNVLTAERDWADLLERMDREPQDSRRSRRA